MFVCNDVRNGPAEDGGRIQNRELYNKVNITRVLRRKLYALCMSLGWVRGHEHQHTTEGRNLQNSVSI